MTKKYLGDADLTASRLREVLSYDPETGVFRWLIRTAMCVQIGQIAGGIGAPDRYIAISVDGVRCQANRLAWLYMTGEWPSDEIDHRDLNKGNNKWSNLRPATKSQNCGNRKRFRHNLSGFKGVTWHKRQKKWNVMITVDRERIHLGCFTDLSNAAKAYEVAAKSMFGEFARIE